MPTNQGGGHSNHPGCAIVFAPNEDNELSSCRQFIHLEKVQCFYFEVVMLQTIINAIHNREFLSFTYRGFSRVVQPTAVGVSRTGSDILRCYQTQGGHVTPGHEWDLCEISKISNLRATGEHFSGEPPEYKRGDKGMITIYAEL